MRHSNILALSAAIWALITTAKPMNHRHLHRRDAVFVTVKAPDVVKTVHVIVQEINGTPVSTLTGTNSAPSVTPQVTGYILRPENSAGVPSNSQPPALTSSAPPIQPKSSEHSPQETNAVDAINSKQVEINESHAEAMIATQAKLKDKQAKVNHAPVPSTEQSQPPVPTSQPIPTQTPSPQQEQPESTTSNNNNNNDGSSSSGSGSSGGSCGQVGAKCLAQDLTIYNDQGLGACGWQNDTNSENFFALAAGTVFQAFLARLSSTDSNLLDFWIFYQRRARATQERVLWPSGYDLL